MKMFLIFSVLSENLDYLPYHYSEFFFSGKVAYLLFSYFSEGFIVYLHLRHM